MPSKRICFFATVIFLTVWTTTACRGRHGNEVENDEGPAAGLVSSVRMNNPATAGQLKKGFYGVESGAWRWTAGDFSVVFRTPPGAATRGGMLVFSFAMPNDKMTNQTLTASIADVNLKSETFTGNGSHTFSTEIPGSALTGDTVTVDFSLDHTIPPTGGDKRELGVVANAMALESK